MRFSVVPSDAKIVLRSAEPRVDVLGNAVPHPLDLRSLATLNGIEKRVQISQVGRVTNSPSEGACRQPQNCVHFASGVAVHLDRLR